MGEKVFILSDKAYRKIQGNYFEAIGNVVITHGKNAIYGEKATLSLETGEAHVIGNVRYVGPTLTLYGSRMQYNFKTKVLTLNNARILAADYVVLGEKIVRHSEDIIVAKNAEYTTCRDCPKSWSFFGRDVHITKGEYVRIWHAFLKINGVVLLYVPYVIFPIKKNRETGLLFPKFGLNFSKGASYQQPFFWVINDHQDATISPGIWGKRGFGNELQYRFILGDKKWFELNSLQSIDRIYEVDKKDEEVSGSHKTRHFTDYEHHLSFGQQVNHHFFYNMASDLDIVRDFRSFTEPKVMGSELGGGGFFDFRASLFTVSFESYFNRNQIVDNSKKFDHSYVQILPKISFSTLPFNLLHTKIFGLNNISLGVDGDFILFKQNHLSEEDYIRNAKRINMHPYVDLQLGKIGPLQFSTRTMFDYQHYRFPYATESGQSNNVQNPDELRKTFSKYGVLHESQVILEIEKIFGLSYKESIPMEKIDIGKTTKKREDFIVGTSDLIGSIPSFKSRYVKDSMMISQHSYRHTQEFKMKHYFLSSHKESGNSRFLNQISKEEGLFDHVDAIRGKEHEFTNVLLRTAIPISNAIEFQWNNVFIKKSAKNFDPTQDNRFLHQNFHYSQIAHFNISQGYDFNVKASKFRDNLTRLYINTGVNFLNNSFSMSEYYFHHTDDHIVSFYLNHNFTQGSLGVGWNYDSSPPVNKTFSFSGTYLPIDLFSLSMKINYDMEEKKLTDSNYSFLYSPRNNCWKLEVKYTKSLSDQQFSFNFLINYNKNNFTSVTGM